MNYLDKILAIIIDSKWHNFDEVLDRSSFPMDQCKIILEFLEDQGFILRDANKIKITNRGLKSQELPANPASL